MIMEDCFYTLQQFETIEWGEKNVVQLPQPTINLINLLSEQVGSPNYVKTPSFTTNDKSVPTKKRRPHDNVKTEDWENVRNFKKTEITKKEGIGKDIDNIRLLINKLTEKSYDKIVDSILETIDSILNEETYSVDSLNIIGYAVFNMATNNKFNSLVYAKLCSILKNKYDFMALILEDNINEFMKLFENMEFVTPEQDYNKFCEINLLNDKRRSMSLFLCNLYKTGVVPLDNIMNNIDIIQSRIVSIMNDESSKLELEELSENLFILITNIEFKTLKTSTGWSDVYDKLLFVKTADIQVNKGISHKSRFKHMDILDKCK